jgi:hypothetical protein
MRVAANESKDLLNSRIRDAFGWTPAEPIEWLSPVESDHYSEYYDECFLQRLGLTDLRLPLDHFWPRGGPRWDGLAKTASGKVILIEAKEYIEEAVDYGSRASPKSREKISAALAQAKTAFRSSAALTWGAPFYQYANRLAHLYFLRENRVDAYLAFLYFADAPDVPEPCSTPQWEGAIRLTEKCLGLGAHPFRNQIASIIVPVTDLDPFRTRANAMRS